MRKNGVLLPIFSLPSKYGIGCFSKEAYAFIDILKEMGQSLWQILPLGPTGYGDSPYQSFSTFAGNPYFIDLEQLVDNRFLTKEECDNGDFLDSDTCINYEKLYYNRFSILRKAYGRALTYGELKKEAYINFCKEQEFWLKDYALYMSVKKKFSDQSFEHWDNDIKMRMPKAVKRYEEELKEEIQFQMYLQYLFFQQWNRLKSYANKNNIQIIGDIPIYVAYDSADAWANPEIFQFDKQCCPTFVAGCPPDGFSKTGQLWGNPLYDWEEHKKTDYKWWIQRIRFCMELYDITRIDHFRGFDEYYAIPFGHTTAKDGKWMKGPGMELFDTIKEKLGDLNIIAEDLGFLTDSVKELLENSGYPGMKVLQFAFDSREESDYLPYNYDKNCVVYTGTHDNDTLKGWYEDLILNDKDLAQTYLNSYERDTKDILWDFICLAMGSKADICIIPIQDFLQIGKSGRINVPSTLGGNWSFRMKMDSISPELINKIRKYTKVYGRIRNIDKN